MIERTLNLIDQELTGIISTEDRDELMELMMMDPAVADELHRRERSLHQNLRSDVEAAHPRLSLLSNAASLALGAGAMLLLSQGVDEGQPGLASTNVYELDNVRSATPQIRPVRIQPDERWVNFVTYPDYADFALLEVRFEAYTGDPAKVFKPAATTWRPVWQSLSTVGNRDALLLTIPGDVVSPGIHRLVVYGIANEVVINQPVHEVIFLLENGVE
jgi:hypothetical protein